MTITVPRVIHYIWFTHNLSHPFIVPSKVFQNIYNTAMRNRGTQTILHMLPSTRAGVTFNSKELAEAYGFTIKLYCPTPGLVERALKLEYGFALEKIHDARGCIHQSGAGGNFAVMSDLARVDILYQEKGGIYLDIDMTSNEKLKQLNWDEVNDAATLEGGGIFCPVTLGKGCQRSMEMEYIIAPNHDKARGQLQKLCVEMANRILTNNGFGSVTERAGVSVFSTPEYHVTKSHSIQLGKYFCRRPIIQNMVSSFGSSTPGFVVPRGEDFSYFDLMTVREYRYTPPPSPPPSPQAAPQQPPPSPENFSLDNPILPDDFNFPKE